VSCRRRAAAGLIAAGLAAAAAGAGCGQFEDPSIVIDLRVLGMVAVPPEQVVPVDPDDPLDVSFDPVQVCALVADPGASRALTWSMTACPPRGDLRCAPDRPSFYFASGRLDDPEESRLPDDLCGRMPAGPELIEIVRDTIEHDSLSGFGGVDINVSLRVVPEGGGEDQAIYAGKAVRFSPQVPAERVANTNPYMSDMLAELEDGTVISLPPGRCRDPLPHLTVQVGDDVHLMPVESDTVREEYVVPTFEGGSRTFTENLTYQWLAGAGDWTSAFSGGPRDAAGREPSIATHWQAERLGTVTGVLDVPVWIVQRDERGGANWMASCIRVTP